MTSGFRKVVERLVEQKQEGDRAPCLSCETPTARATLAQYGARCFHCHEAYCASAFAPQPHRNDTPTQADMRKRLHGRTPERNVLNRSDDDGRLDPVRIEAAKRDAQAKFDAFARMSVAQRTQALRDGESIR